MHIHVYAMLAVAVMFSLIYCNLYLAINLIKLILTWGPACQVEVLKSVLFLYIVAMITPLIALKFHCLFDGCTVNSTSIKNRLMQSYLNNSA